MVHPARGMPISRGADVTKAKQAQKPTMTDDDIQRMFDEMGLGTEAQRAAYHRWPIAEPKVAFSEEPREMVFIRTGSVSVVLDK